MAATEFASDDKQVTFAIDTYANSEGKSIGKYDPMVATIAKGFDPGAKTNFDVQDSP
jgi:hypothetical protein